MSKGRYIAILAASGLAAAGAVSMSMSSPAAAAPAGPRPVSNWLRPVEANTPTWVNIGWQTSSRICDVQVRVDGGRRVDVEYPGFRRYSSLSRGNSLAAHRLDFSAVRVDVDSDRGGVASLLTVIRYDNCGWHARTQTRAFRLNLPVRPDRHGGHGNGNGNGGWGNGGHNNGGHDNGGNNDPHPRPTRTWTPRPTTTPTATPTTTVPTTPTTAPTTTTPTPTHTWTHDPSNGPTTRPTRTRGPQDNDTTQTGNQRS
jgi:hypothetical protein